MRLCLRKVCVAAGISLEIHRSISRACLAACCGPSFEIDHASSVFAQNLVRGAWQRTIGAIERCRNAWLPQLQERYRCCGLSDKALSIRGLFARLILRLVRTGELISYLRNHHVLAELKLAVRFKSREEMLLRTLKVVIVPPAAFFRLRFSDLPL